LSATAVASSADTTGLTTKLSGSIGHATGGSIGGLTPAVQALSSA
jgi:hypothetical protein